SPPHPRAGRNGGGEIHFHTGGSPTPPPGGILRLSRRRFPASFSSFCLDAAGSTSAGARKFGFPILWLPRKTSNQTTTLAGQVHEQRAFSQAPRSTGEPHT